MNKKPLSYAELEKSLAAKLRELLGKVEWLNQVEVQAMSGPDKGYDLLAVLPLPGAGKAALCVEHGWSWFDLAGNHRLDIPGLLRIQRTGKPPVHSSSKPTANLSTAEAGRVIRALLAPENAGLRWTQWEMQKECAPKVSIGLVNKVARHLREEASDGGFRLRDPLKLLVAWRDAYRFDRHERRAISLCCRERN